MSVVMAMMVTVSPVAMVVFGMCVAVIMAMVIMLVMIVMLVNLLRGVTRRDFVGIAIGHSSGLSPSRVARRGRGPVCLDHGHPG
jgi:ABC-type nitrate/sulfonate/bicarbonate transport system permease component